MLKSYKTTVFEDRFGFTNIIYHSTSVVAFNDNEIILDTGGWYTKTTKERMNEASRTFNLGFSVYQKNYQWFIDYQGQTIPFDNSVKTLTRGEQYVQ